MPHADSSLLPSTISTKEQFWQHVYQQLEALNYGQRHWISNLSNAASLVFNSLAAFDSHFGTGPKAVNWCGFYIHESLFPAPRFTSPSTQTADLQPTGTESLLLGPFCGKPACQLIRVAPLSKARGVCADAFNKKETLLVEDVNSYPGHIACDGETNSEIVSPIVLRGQNGQEDVPIGVFDLDCLALNGFGEEDKKGIEKIVELLVKGCDW